jgi:hypothetical protein
MKAANRLRKLRLWRNVELLAQKPEALASPFPLIVAVDWAKVIYVPYGRSSEPDDPYHGGSGRAVFLWLFGLKIELPHWHRAHRTVMSGG